MKFNKLINEENIIESNGDLTIEISGIEYDSRKIKKGDVFVAVKGYETDGHKYIESAVKNGASAVIMQEKCDCSVPYIITENTRKSLADASNVFYDYPTKKLTLIGVTGTNGKTTVTYLVKSILEFAGHKVGLIGTNQNMIGDKVIESKRTTPESLELCRIFDQMVKDGSDYAVMEVSSHSLVLDRVSGFDFAIGAFTNLTQDHLDFHKTMEEYARAKSLLFKMCKKGVVNADDAWCQKICEGATCDIVKYSIHKKSDIFAHNIKYTQRGVHFDVETPFGKDSIRLDIPGEFSVYNALTAIGICQSAGIGIKDIANALVLAKGVKGRAEVVNIPTNYTVMIDYAHTPDGLENIIKTVRGFCKGRVVTVFGCGGDRDATKRPKMGKIAGDLSDFCVVTSDNPRSENPSAIIKDILEGMKDVKAEYVTVENRRDAIKYAMEHAKENDVVILAGKGHETYQILNTGTIDFDEHKIVKEILAEINAK